MANQLQVRGASPTSQVHYAPMWTGRFFSGVITQRSPLRGNTTRLEETFYGVRGDEMLSGLNTEISPKLTLIRRPGLSVYNSNSLPAVNRFYEFRNLVNGSEGIKVLSDLAPQSPSTVGTVRDVTGPSNNVTLWNKAPNSGITSFQSVGNTLYASDLSNARKYLLSTVGWSASASFNQDQFVVDSNNNLQLNVGSQTATITNIEISGYVSGYTSLVSGSGYTSVPTVTISGGGGSGAAATCTILSGGIHSITITQPGSGYTSVPTFTFTGGGGTGASATGVLTGNSVVLFFNSTTPLTVPTNTGLTLSGLTTVPALNGTTIYVSSSANSSQITAPFSHSILAYATETGSATTGTGITGSSSPAWQTAIGAITADGGAQWENRGSAVQNWGITPPTTAPSVTQVAAPSIYSEWARNTWYAPLFVIEDSNGNLQQLTTAGITGTLAPPTWATTIGATTNDNNGGPGSGYAVWTCMGPAAWKAGYAYTVGAVIQATFTYYITTFVPSPKNTTNSFLPLLALLAYHGPHAAVAHLLSCLMLAVGVLVNGVWGYYESTPVTVTCLFQCTTAGTSGTTAPSWTNGLGTTVTGDGGVSWVNMGNAPSWPGTAQTLSLATQVIDLNNNIQDVQSFGKSGASAPTWQTTSGSTTTDNTASWLYSGSFGSANTGAWIYAYSWENSITEAISTASPQSASITQNADQQVVIQGAGSPDTQVDTIDLWRTVQGGATLFYLGSVPNPAVTSSSTSFYIASNVAYINTTNSFSTGQTVYLQSFMAGSFFNQETVTLLAATPTHASFAFTHANVGSSGSPIVDTAGTLTNGGTWIYTDTTPDTYLNVLIEAPIDYTNNPPPVGLQALTYHLERVWGAVGNLVYYSDGPDVQAGNGEEAWSPGNVFAYPETVVRLFPMSSGLIVFTLSDVYIIQGLGTSSNPLSSLPLLQDVGLSSYDAFDVNGSIVYMYTSDNQLVSLDPSSGVSEIGFAIGDQFGPENGTGTFTPLTTHVTWHIAGSPDKGLYVSDFYGNWWRMSPTPSPETGITWSPIANFLPSVGGFSAVQSVETSPGTHTLLVGPPSSPSGTLGPILKRDYTVHTDNGTPYAANAVFGSLVLAQPGQLAIVESLTTDSVAVGIPLSLAVQLDEIAPVSLGYFEGLTDFVPDPTEISASNSIYGQRFYLSQTQQPSICRHLQVEVNFGKDTVQNELLSMTLFGGFEQEK